MKQLIRGKKISLFFIAVGCVGSIYYCFARLSCVNQVTFSFDSCVASPVRDSVIKTVQNSQSKSSFEHLGDLIHQQFPTIRAVAFERCAPTMVHCTVVAHKPLVAISNDEVVAESGQIFKKNFFTPRSVDHLFHVDVPTTHAKERLPVLFVASMYKLMPSFFYTYDIAWVDEHELWLRDKAHEFSLVCNAHALPDAATLSYCAQIREQLLTVQKEKKGRKQQWAADIRFDHQIVLFEDKEGVRHG